MTDNDNITNEDFDHIAEAKELLAHVDATVGVLDVTQSIQFAQVHALIALAQAVEATAYVSDLDGFRVASIEADAAYPGANYWHPSMTTEGN